MGVLPFTGRMTLSRGFRAPRPPLALSLHEPITVADETVRRFFETRTVQVVAARRCD